MSRNKKEKTLIMRISVEELDRVDQLRDLVFAKQGYEISRSKLLIRLVNSAFYTDKHEAILFNTECTDFGDIILTNN
jgi:hypothetical protein